MLKSIRYLFVLIYLLFARNWLTIVGASIVTTSAFAIIIFLALAIFGVVGSPYVGIIAFLILPFVFILGLVLIPLGHLSSRREWKKEHTVDGAEHQKYPSIDFNKPAVRRTAGLLAFLTCVNIFIISTVSYKGVVFMDSTQFCGQVCHTVMQPEYTAYLNSPHSRVKCAECHIGAGAPWFVKAKISGARQVLAVLFNTYEKPIATPVHSLRPSRDICEECHWPEKFVGDRMKIVTDYNADETNTPITSALLMHIGGGASSSHHGIHSWHIDPSRKTRYLAADAQRSQISLVRVESDDGGVTDFVASDAKIDPASVKSEDMREMDCIDCHNRPTHIYKLPARAVNESITHGRIDRSIPYVKMVTVEALEQAKGETGDLQKIEEHIKNYYQTNYAELMQKEPHRIDGVIREVQNIYSTNVFPDMDVTWGTYPAHIGHVDSPGCFRCHDDGHVAKTGEAIRQDCTICHAVLAMQEENPSILQDLGLQETEVTAAPATETSTEPEPAPDASAAPAEPAQS